MKRTFLFGAGAGALLAYFFDPDEGRLRRTRVRDRIYGRLSHGEHEVPDEVLVQRVRSRLGRVVTHPGSIDVKANRGTITLEGPVLRRELKRMVRAVWAVPGVQGVDCRVQAYKEPGNIPGLQGGSPRRAAPGQGDWSPGMRFAAGLGGAAAACYGLARRSAATPLLIATGAGLLACAATHSHRPRLARWRGRRSVELQKSLFIQAPADELFSFWSNPENFPRFMRNVRSVKRNRDGSWHWEVAGPFGRRVQWDAEITQSVPGRVIGWATRPGVSVEHSGVVHFTPEGIGTRIDVRMTYSPAFGAVGHAIASLFGADPQTELDADLMRLKDVLETRKAPGHFPQSPAHAASGEQAGVLWR